MWTNICETAKIYDIAMLRYQFLWTSFLYRYTKVTTDKDTIKQRTCIFYMTESQCRLEKFYGIVTRTLKYMSFVIL